MTKARRIFNATAGVLFLGGLGYYFYGYASAEKRLKTMCAEIEPGMTLDALRGFAKEQGLGPGPTGDGVRYLGESRTFGRYGCRVTIEEGMVKESLYNFSD